MPIGTAYAWNRGGDPMSLEQSETYRLAKSREWFEHFSGE